MYVLTVATSITPQVKNLICTLKQHGTPYRVLGVGRKWTGFRVKMEEYGAACAALPPDTEVLCIDSGDVLQQAPFPATSTLLPPGVRLLVGAEIFCDPTLSCNPDVARVLGIDPEEPYKYVNTGVILGRADEIATMMQWALRQGYTDDQLAVCDWIVHQADLGHASRYALDVQHRLVWNVNVNMALRDAMLVQPAPPLIHFPGKYLDYAYDSATGLLLDKAPLPGPNHGMERVVHHLLLIGLLILITFILCRFHM